MQSREYQTGILKTCLEKNTLCVLPTGLGKTNIAVMLAAHRLSGKEGSRALVLAPTRPLVEQHYRSFMKHMNLEDVEFSMVTGTLKPQERKKVYDDRFVRVIFATPQTARNDLKSGILRLEDYSLLVIDETHHSVGMYAYPFVVEKYTEQARDPRILGLTASPGSDLAKIKEVMRNTGLDAVEIRGEEEGDVSPYVKEKTIEHAYVELPERFRKVEGLISHAYNARLMTLERMGYIRSRRVSKKGLLEVQARLARGLKQGHRKSMIGMFHVNQAIKLEHALMLLQTQGISVLDAYWRKVRAGQTKADQALSNDRSVSNAMFLTNSLREEGARHPKVGRLLTLVSRQLADKPGSRIIVFANFRDTVKEIVSSLEHVTAAMAVEFVGQREGMTQREQARALEDFSAGKHNVLVCTSIGEEGLDIPSMDLAIFYEPVPSGIRSIQRRGRVGRQAAGRVVFLITRGTRDEAYFWSARHKESSMRNTLYGMKGMAGSLDSFGEK